ncbi:cytochrome b/b6 domain-containing protein [Dongshaea marina]|uniref:cytochrome b/b6 domain-containing protein n=1 Tax=Dongshaea marina TaxID=2047966 RepID=UPI000D3E266E|nr:cytochrome b/b6 domain-containing protein [Dongshaea marina]
MALAQLKARSWVQKISGVLRRVVTIDDSSTRPVHSWTTLNKTLHISFASLIILQLLSSDLMHSPWKPGRVVSDFSAFFFYFHLIAGCLTLFVLVCYFLLNLSEAARAHLYPWGRQGRADIMADLRQIFCQRKMQPAHRCGGLAGLVHGLGFLAAVGTALTGASWLLLRQMGFAPDLVHFVKECHEFMTTFVWIYVIGHVCLAVVHFLVEDDSHANG